jgi:acyl carrier protein
MDNEEILKEVIHVLKSSRCPLENIDAETRVEDLELDSIELTKLLMDLEDHFSILVPDQTWAKWQNIGDVIEYISNYQKEFGGLNLKEM